jgi:hypothetical protein
MTKSYNPQGTADTCSGCGGCCDADFVTLDDGFREMVEFVEAAFQASDSTTTIPSILEELGRELTQRLQLSGVSLVFRTDVKLIGATSNEIKVGLGTHDLPKQTRLHKHGDFDYRTETRSQWEVAYAKFTGTSLEQIRSQIVDCTRGAVTSAVVAAIWAQNPSLAYELFVPAWKICMYALLDRAIVDGIQVWFGSDTEAGCWENHC